MTHDELKRRFVRLLAAVLDLEKVVDHSSEVFRWLDLANLALSNARAAIDRLPEQPQ